MKKIQILKLLYEAREAATYGNASFGNKGEDFFIKEKTKLHRETWIIPQITEAIELIKKG
jgi:hypothetical protein